MPDPILPNIIRAQVILHGTTGLSKDRFVNTFAFESVGGFVSDHQAEHDEALRLLGNFYTALNGGTASIVSFLTGYSKAELRTYHLGDALPREPIITDPWAVFPMASGDPLPQELAVCASFQSARRGPRGRGRVYIGPFKTSAMEGGETHDSIPDVGLRTAMRLAMSTMSADDAVLRWGIVSPTDAAFYPVTGGWVDDAWDIQRSRGQQPTARDGWGSAL